MTAFYFEIWRYTVVCVHACACALPLLWLPRCFLHVTCVSASHASSRFSHMIEWLHRCHGDHSRPWPPPPPLLPHPSPIVVFFFSLPFPPVLRKVSGNQQIANQAASLRRENRGQMRRSLSDPFPLSFFFFFFSPEGV